MLKLSSVQVAVPKVCPFSSNMCMKQKASFEYVLFACQWDRVAIQSGSFQSLAEGFNVLHPVNKFVCCFHSTMKTKQNIHGTAEIVMFSAEVEAILLLRYSTKVKEEVRGLEHPMGTVCFHQKFYLLSKPRYKLCSGNNSSFRIFSWANCLASGAPQKVAKVLLGQQAQNNLL